MIIVMYVLSILSVIPLFLIPVGTGGWLLCGIVAGVIVGYTALGHVAMGMISDDYIGFSRITHGLWLLVSGALTAGAGGLAIYCLAMLIWRGAGIEVNVNVQQ